MATPNVPINMLDYFMSLFENGVPEKPDAGIPPKPPTMPEVTPVASLKNQTALRNQYTDEAARDLYKTPTKLDLSKSGMSKDIEGFYVPNLPRISNYLDPLLAYQRWRGTAPEMGYITIGDAENKPQVLAHEFAHAWEDQYMPWTQVSDWQMRGPSIATDYAHERFNRDYPPGSDQQAELYALGTEQGPSAIPKDLRQSYYGMYKPDITPPKGSLTVLPSTPAPFDSSLFPPNIKPFDPTQVYPQRTLERPLTQQQNFQQWYDGIPSTPNPWYSPVFTNSFGMAGG